MPSFKTYFARVKLRTIHPLASRQLDDRIRRQWRTDTGAVVAVAAAVAARLGEDAERDEGVGGQQGNCFKCGEAGHCSMNCPN